MQHHGTSEPRTGTNVGILRAIGAIVVVSALSGCANPAPPDAAFGEIETEVRRLSDLREIESLLLDYGRFLDARDFESYAELFASDGEWIGGFGTVQGPPQIQSFMEDAIPGPNTGNTYHLLSNFKVDIDGDSATAWSRWAFVTGGTSDSPTIAQGGHYDDALVRENGRWKFQRREAVLDIPVNFPPQTD